MNEYLTFKKMITPVIIQVLFWVGIVACILGGLFMFSQSFLQGLLIILIGPVLVRVYCEILIVLFSIHETLIQIKNK